uniref:Rhamnogalacturonan lyase domain-containing protein n=1 Tax=Aegilops tauschii subsp. strangulata TaxID=200361 RepID=A0A453RRM1_AEGTS
IYIIRYIIEDEDLYAASAYVGLALPGEAGSWQRECKGYQFWCQADADGSFYIKNIVTGNYNLYAWVPGFIGDYRFDATLTISSEGTISIWVTSCSSHRETARLCGRSEYPIGLLPSSTFQTPTPTM